LNLYFNALATVEIEFTIGGVLTGSMIEIGTETIALTLEMTDTSTVNPSDVITETLWQVSDGEKKYILQRRFSCVFICMEYPRMQ